MYVLYRLTKAENDPRHNVVYQNYNFQIVEVANEDWINWEDGDPQIFPDHLVAHTNNLLRPLSKGYRHKITGEMTSTKKGDPDLHEKVERPWTADEAAEVLEFSKIILKRRLEEIYRHRISKFQTTHLGVEISTWDQQRKEAEAGSGVLIEAIANARKMPISVLINKIKNKAAEYDAEVGKLLGEKQGYADKMEACNTIRELALLAEQYFGMPRHKEFGTASISDFQVHI